MVGFSAVEGNETLFREFHDTYAVTAALAGVSGRSNQARLVSSGARACPAVFLPSSQTQEEEETAVQHAAAVKIQSRMRTHLRTKASTTVHDTATATTATTTTTSTATKKSAAGPAAGGGSGQQGGSPPPSSSGKESTHPSTVTPAPGGPSAAADGGAAARGAGGETSEEETGISRATRQMQVRMSVSYEGLRELKEFCAGYLRQFALSLFCTYHFCTVSVTSRKCFPY